MEARRRWQARANALRSLREGHLPQEPPVEYSPVGKELEAIQKRALAEGLPYQTLISSLLHKYASGRLKDV